MCAFASEFWDGIEEEQHDATHVFASPLHPDPTYPYTAALDHEVGLRSARFDLNCLPPSLSPSLLGLFLLLACRASRCVQGSYGGDEYAASPTY